MARNDGNLSTPSNNKPGHEKECKGKTAQLREAGPVPFKRISTPATATENKTRNIKEKKGN
jgi:hypothetical protein